MSDPLLLRVADALGSLYDIESEIGRGGMAVVYRARDRRLRRPVAIKVPPPDTAFRGYTRRFLHEAETAAQLDHPSTVPIYTVDERDGLVYFVMALVDGESLAARRARVRARARRRPPRHQAGQHPPRRRRRRRARDGERLQHRPGAGGGRAHD